ncbi:MAG: penicillin-binding protein 2 [Fimbriimonadales bacterium]|nr:penicillin-binding protein 2 [Fimbriimonadales bacterium]
MRVGMVDREGRFVPWLSDVLRSRPSQDGEDIELTINAEIQQWAMQTLIAQCERHRPTSGVVVVLEPKTGDILALATYPSFEPADVLSASWQTVRGARGVAPELNPAVAFRLEPGSMFKAFTVALALDKGVITEGDVVHCAGQITVGKHVIHCAGDYASRVHSAVNPARCIEVSCNVTAAVWGMKLGFDRLANMIRELGLLEKPGVGLPGEVPGDLSFSEVNKTLQCANLGFGQSLNVTHVALASAFGVFANDGRLVRPRLIKRIGDREIPPVEGPQVFTPETARKVLKMMERVIQGEKGTGRSLRIPSYRLAGKSGTAQTPDPETGSLRSGLHISSFVGYVPADNPKAVILVMLDKPRSGEYYGAKVAGPVFRQLAQFLIQYWNLPPSGEES